MITLLEVSDNIPDVQADGGTDTAAIGSSSVLVVGASGALLEVKRRSATDKGTGLKVTTYPSLRISVTSASICITGV